jgi:hypothetical protein
LSDVLALVEYLFKGGKAPVCLFAGDFNEDELLNVSDPIAIIQHLFGSDQSDLSQNVFCG